MNVTDVARANLGLRTSAGRFARSTVVELIERPHLNEFQLDCLIHPNVDVHPILIPARNNFVGKSIGFINRWSRAAKLKGSDQFALFIVYTKQLNSKTEIAHRKLLRQKVMHLPYTRVQVRHFSILQN